MPAPANIARWNQPGLRWGMPGLRWNQPAPGENKTMPNDNRISAAITPANKTAFIGHMTDAAALIPFSVNLTPEERGSLQNISTARSGMLDAFTQEMTAHPNLIPSYLDMTEVNKDAALLRDVWQMRSASESTCERLDDGAICLSSDLMIAFSIFWAIVKDARKRNVPGIDATYDRLAPYFAKFKNKPNPPTP
jgi:hypothetical protein